MLGCGWLRKTPEGADKPETEKRFAEILYKIAELAEEFGLQLILEPLCSEETDIINTFEEGLAVCRAAEAVPDAEPVRLFRHQPGKRNPVLQCAPGAEIRQNLTD